MSRAMLAAFPGPEPLTAAVQSAAEHGQTPVEAFSPYPMHEVAKLLGKARTNVPWYMLAGGLTTACLFFFMEWLSATRLYRFDQGGRPFNSWPAFFVATVEISVLIAGLTGFVTVLLKCGLPRLNHPLFAHTAFERASQDQFMLALDLPGAPEAAGRARQFLYDAGALWIEEVEL